MTGPVHIAIDVAIAPLRTNLRADSREEKTFHNPPPLDFFLLRRVCTQATMYYVKRRARCLSGFEKTRVVSLDHIFSQ